MRLKTILNVMLFFFCQIGQHTAQDKRYYFRHYDISAGLSDNSVFAIHQDEEGFMWFGTKYGLNRFDGTSWKVFNSDTKGISGDKLHSNFIYHIHEEQGRILWLGTADGIFTFDKETERFKSFPYRTQNSRSPTGPISHIAEDRAGNIWIAGNTMGLFRLDGESKELTLFEASATHGFPSGNISSVTVDSNDDVWIGVIGDGVYRYSSASPSFKRYMDEDNSLPKAIIYSLLDWGDRLLIGTKNSGVKLLDKRSGKITSLLSHDKNGHPILVRDMHPVSTTEVGIGTESGLYIYDFATDSYQNLQENLNDPYSLSNNAIYSLKKDREGGLWVGTYFGGINYLPIQPFAFEKYYPVTNTNSVSGKRVREIIEGDNGKLWIGTEDAGLNLFDPKTGRFEAFTPGETPDGISYRNIHGLAKRGKELWIGTFSQGINVMELETGKVRKYNSKSGVGLGNDDIFALLSDSKGQIWVGSGTGLYRFDDEKRRFTQIPEIGRIFVYDLMEDSTGRIWIATYSNGLLRYHPDRKTVHHFTPDSTVQGSIPHFSVIDLFEDSKNRIWIATEGGGFARFNPEQGDFTSYTIDKGFPSNTYFKILEDNSGLLWITSNRGLVEFDPERGTFRLFTEKHGLAPTLFNYRSGHRTPDGTLYFGSQYGFTRFHPDQFRTYTFQPKTVITGIQLFNEEIPINPDGGILRKSITDTDQITLESFQNSLSFDIASLGYTQSQPLSYKMEGFDQNWQELDGARRIFYSYLPPGDYSLVVKPLSHTLPGSAQEARLGIHILPPFYMTTLAYVVYLLGTVLIAYALIFRYKRRVNRRHRASIHRLEAEKEKELYEAKIDFFTTITHEIRTPLTLIKGPLESILGMDTPYAPEVKEDLLTIEKNTDRLIDLSNQLLDFRKAERRGFKLNFIKTELGQLLDELYYRFKVTTAQAGINFTVNKAYPTLFADIDREAVIKILSNLLLNALKNADTMLHVELDYDPASPALFRIEVRNDGDLIPENQAHRIFEPFYQLEEVPGRAARQGTGLGLPLARSLAEMHHGSLTLIPDRTCNRFLLELPIKQQEVIVLEEEDQVHTLPDKKVSRVTSPRKRNSLPAILLVEDNKELLRFLGDKLRPNYVIYKAANGLVALNSLKRHPIDLVISDVMMPEMDGFTLCRAIKSDLETSHIPVVLLTAKNNSEAKLTGLEMGADVYIEKPFSLESLHLQLRNLLTHRDQIKKAFANTPHSNPDSIAHTRADEDFIRKLSEVILENLEDQRFGVNELAASLHMSQSSLLRKIKGISELNPNSYIRVVRLRKAAELLKEGHYSIAEISERVGFNSPSYFSKCFQKHFGQLPKDYVKKTS